MGINIFVPAFSGGKKATKDLIIEIIIECSALSVRQIELRLEKQFGHAVTYQAVRKAVLHLAREGVLEKHGKHFSLRKGWIASLNDFCENLEKETHYDFFLRDGLKNESQKSLLFKTLAERWDYVQKFEKMVLPKLKKKVVVSQVPHLYYLSIDPHWIKCRLSQFKKFRIRRYRVCNGKTPLDKTIAELYDSHGTKTKIGVAGYKDSSWFVVYDDIVFQTIVKRKPKKSLEDRLSKHTTLDKDFFNLFEELQHKKLKIEVIVHKNEGLANRIRAQILNNFRLKTKT